VTHFSETDLGFRCQAYKFGGAAILRHGKIVTRLGAGAAAKFMNRMAGLDFKGQQQLMARLTGNYKRGNESRDGVDA